MYFPMELCSTPHEIGRFKDGSFPLFSIVIVDHCATVILTLHYITFLIYSLVHDRHITDGVQLWVLLCSGERLQVVSGLALASVQLLWSPGHNLWSSPSSENSFCSYILVVFREICSGSFCFFMGGDSC